MQQTEKLLKLSKGEKKMVKKFKSFVKEEDLKDFEEDVLGETPPNTADAMKRFKAGKAGFTDKAHLKAGLILVAMVRKKYQTNTNRGKGKRKTFKQHIKEHMHRKVWW